jgi:LysM repeat protein
VPTSCGRPPGWVQYVVRSGDTLSSISEAYGITIAQLQSANCLSTTKIYTGQILWVPNVPTATPKPTDEPTDPPTFTPTLTHTPLPTDTPTNTPPPTDTPLPTDTPPPPTDTPEPTSTDEGTIEL